MKFKTGDKVLYTKVDGLLELGGITVGNVYEVITPLFEGKFVQLKNDNGNIVEVLPKRLKPFPQANTKLAEIL